MRIGVYIAGESPTGGNYQYSLTLVSSLRMIKESRQSGDDYVIFRSSERLKLPQDVTSGFAVVDLPGDSIYFRVLKRLSATLKYSAGKINLFQKTGRTKEYRLKHNKKLHDFLVKNGIELMIYPSAEAMSFETAIPYIIAIHDIQYRLHPGFPEVGSGGERNFREYIFKNAADNALKILVDSNTGREDVVNEFGTAAEKVEVLPFVAGPMYKTGISVEEKESLRRKYNLPDEYLFYPANFWSHKNHISIIKALGLLKRERGLEIPVVFTGSKKEGWGEFDKVFKLVAESGLDKQVFYLGFVDLRSVPVLYSMAKALVMPTFFGPTNIPPLEAFASGCPVITSNIRGVREQVGDAGMLVDPGNPAELADAIYNVWTNGELSAKLIERGYSKIKAWTIEDFSGKLASIIDECKNYILGEKSLSGVGKS